MSKITHLAMQGVPAGQLKQALKGYCLSTLWEVFEEDFNMGEQAALHTVCEVIGIKFEDAHDLMIIANDTFVGGKDEQIN